MSYAVKNMPDPPDVARCIVTGYPERRRGMIVDRCVNCGAHIYEDEAYYDSRGNIVCAGCAPNFVERLDKAVGA